MFKHIHNESLQRKGYSLARSLLRLRPPLNSIVVPLRVTLTEIKRVLGVLFGLSFLYTILVLLGRELYNVFQGQALIQLTAQVTGRGDSLWGTCFIRQSLPEDEAQAKLNEQVALWTTLCV